MAIDTHTARFLIACRSAGISFERTATLGRQNLYVGIDQVRGFHKEYDVPAAADEGVLSQGGEFADGLFKMLGARELISIDASQFEGATWVHDMNDPIPPEWRGRFDVVFDGGTLEHVFNFPTALKSCMDMVRVGGHLIMQTPANNHCGHGFYQFSPELFFRVLSEENGFAVQRMIAVEVFPGARWYEVADPAKVHSRVEVGGSKHRVLLLLCARRTREADLLVRPPQQSDYVLSWDQNTPHEVRYQFGLGGRRWRAAAPLINLISSMRGAALGVIGRCGPAAARWATACESADKNRRLYFTEQPVFFRAVEK